MSAPKSSSGPWCIAKHVLALAAGTAIGAVLCLAIVLLGYSGWAWGFLAVPVLPLIVIPAFLHEIHLNENVRTDPRPSFHLTAIAAGIAVPLLVLLGDLMD